MAPLSSDHHSPQKRRSTGWAGTLKTSEPAKSICRGVPGYCLGVRRNFSEGNVTGGAHELTELSVRDRRSIHPETVDRDPVNGALFGIVPVRPHAERAAVHPKHVVVGRFRPGTHWTCVRIEHVFTVCVGTRQPEGRGRMSADLCGACVGIEPNSLRYDLEMTSR